MKDLRLTRIGSQYDLKIDNGKLSWAEDGTAVAQKVLVRLRKVYGESIYSPTQGMKWYETIFDATRSRAEKELELKRVILGTEGVVKITKFEWTQTGRSLALTLCVLTEYGEEQVGGVSSPL